MGKECPNCGKLTNTSHTRLIKDSCGHTKCRLCLLHEENGCKSCKNESEFHKIDNFGKIFSHIVLKLLFRSNRNIIFYIFIYLDYPTKDSFYKIGSDAIECESLISNSTTESIKPVMNKIISKHEFISCGTFPDSVEESNFATNETTVSCEIGKDNKQDKWSLKIAESENETNLKNCSVEEKNSKSSTV